MSRDLFSRLVNNKGSTTFYEQIQDHDHLENRNRPPSDVDEENLAHDFHDDDLPDAEHLGLDDSQMSTRDTRRGVPSNRRQPAESRWLVGEDDVDNDVPASLLVEGPSAGNAKGKAPASKSHQARRQGSSGQPNRRRIQAQWETAQAHQRLHRDEDFGAIPGRDNQAPQLRRPGLVASPKDKAMFRWANVSNLDVFIRDVYDYYLGAGLWCIILDRLLHLLYVPEIDHVIICRTDLQQQGRLRRQSLDALDSVHRLYKAQTEQEPISDPNTAVHQAYVGCLELEPLALQLLFRMEVDPMDSGYTTAHAYP